MCLSSTQPLHSAASGIVGKLHRLLKIEQAATLRAIFLLGRGVGGAGERGGGGWPKAHFMVKISCELRRQKTNMGSSSPVRREHVLLLGYIYIA